VDPAELLLRDALLRRLPSRPAAKVAVVLIDEEALRVGGSWPWDRARLAGLVQGVFDAGAKGVVIDLLLPEERAGDALLARALERGPSLLAAGMDDSGGWVLPNRALRAAALGHVSYDLDRDGVVRRFSSTKQRGERVLPALSVAAARLGDPRRPVPVGVTLRPGYHTWPIPTVDATTVLAGRPAEILRQRIVFIGISAAGVGDRFVSPLSREGSPDPGVLVEAVAAEAILSGDLMREAPPVVDALLAFGLALLGAYLMEARGRARRALAPAVLLAPPVFALAAQAFLKVELAPLAMLLPLVVLAGLARVRWAGRAMGDARSRIEELERLQSGQAALRTQDAEARRVVAHELKTPLTSMKGLAQLLAQFNLSVEERNRVAGMVVSETSRLARMVDDLLDLERLGLRDFHRDARPLDLSALWGKRVEFLRAGTSRAVTPDLAAGLGVMGDPALLDRVLENLVANAVKFSPEGAPVAVVLREEEGWAVLEVTDRGPGIPDGERDRIFGRFARGSAQGMAQGLGLGLALVAEVVAWHRGEVRVLEGPGGGSVFRVRLPLVRRAE